MSNELDELPPSLKRANMMLAGAHPFINPLSMAGVIQYAINCLRESRVKTFPPARIISVMNCMAGESCAHIEERLMKYSICPSVWNIGPYTIQGGNICLVFDIMVPARQAWIADVVLRWFEGQTYIVESAPIVCPKRGSSAEYAANSAPWVPKGGRPRSRTLNDLVFRAMFGALFDQSKISASIMREIEKMRAEKGKIGSTAKPKAKTSNAKRKKNPESKLIKFLKS